MSIPLSFFSFCSPYFSSYTHSQRIKLDMDQFVDWFKEHHGTIDAESMVLTDIPGQGRGAIALRDIPVCVKMVSP